jgi:tRNA1(Val) A37 N6-methylase TrmN6
LESHYGIDLNSALTEPYKKIIAYLATKAPTQIQLHIGDAVLFDYTTLEYDTVFSSPPYYFIEKYANNQHYASKKEMNENFYKPLFSKTFAGLQPGGHYIINICQEVYVNVLQKLLGDALECFPLKKSKRQNDYTEMVYVWRKL